MLTSSGRYFVSGWSNYLPVLTMQNLRIYHNLYHGHWGSESGTDATRPWIRLFDHDIVTVLLHYGTFYATVIALATVACERSVWEQNRSIDNMSARKLHCLVSVEIEGEVNFFMEIFIICCSYFISKAISFIDVFRILLVWCLINDVMQTRPSQ